MTDPTYPTILVLGRDTCEDTTRSRRHLAARGVPFAYRRVDEDLEAETLILGLNDGTCTTPTILFGDPEAPFLILREPSNDELDAALRTG